MFRCGDALNENTDWLNVVFLKEIVQSFLAAPLVALVAEDLNVCIKPDSGGGAEPCIILYTRQMFLYVMRFSHLSSLYFLRIWQ